LCTIWIFCL